MPYLLRCRCGLVLVLSWAAVGLLAPLLFVVASSFRPGHSTRPLTVDVLVVDAASLVLTAALLMLLLSIGLVALETLVGDRLPVVRRVSTVGCSPWGRRLALALCGLGIAAPIVSTPALAGGDDCGTSACPTHALDPGRVGLDGLPMPELPSHPAPAPALEGPGPPQVNVASAPTPQVTVHAGDSLWRIVERELPRHASDAAVAVCLDEWYARNRAVIGPEPDLIFPGTELQRPEVAP